MNVGFINFYPYRPHGHHAEYLRSLVDTFDGSIFALDCRSSIPTCYLREVKGVGRSECFKCTLGGLSSFNFEKAESVRKYSRRHHRLEPAQSRALVESSSYTLARIESAAQTESEEVLAYQQKLEPSVEIVLSAVQNWITTNNIDAVMLFNGRMDITRAALEACKQAGVPCVTHERPLFGHGLILNLNDNCSSLKKIHRINKEFSDKPLSSSQLSLASKLLAQRFRGENKLEWKRYNENPLEVTEWPLDSDRKVLICPSSKNELLGHPDWETEWSDNTDALDILIAASKISPRECVVRFHPSWSVSFGKSDAKKCVDHYSAWCEKHGIFYYESDSSVNTRDLIRLSDLVILNGSNTILESGALGKPSLCLGPSPYTFSGCAVDILAIDQLKSLDVAAVLAITPDFLIRRTLRYAYAKAEREPLFVNNVRSASVTECEFFEGADPQDLMKVVGGQFIVNDQSFDEFEYSESKVVAKFLEWDVNYLEESASAKEQLSSNLSTLDISRSGLYRVIDKVRNLSPKGI
jgi:hypothetical protein